MSLNLVDLGSKTRSLGQVKEIPCGCSRSHISCSIDLKFSQNVCLDEISVSLNFGHLCKTLGQIKEIPCRCSIGHISCPIDLKITQNVYLDKSLDEFEFGSPRVINKVTRSS